jgi:hypothetical protein
MNVGIYNESMLDSAIMNKICNLLFNRAVKSAVVRIYACTYSKNNFSCRFCGGADSLVRARVE